MSAKQNFFLPRPRGLLVFSFLLGFALLFLPLPLRAQSLEDAAHVLAMKVCLGGNKQAFRVAWQESPQSSGYLNDSRRKIFLDQVSACGMTAAENADAPVLMVTMQVTASKALLIADWTDAAGGRQTYMAEVSRPSLFVARDASPAPQLRRELLWQQEKPIQSALEWQDPQTEEHFLFLLSDSQFLRFRWENGTWKKVDFAEFLPIPRRSRAGEASLFYSRSKDQVELVLRRKVCDLDLSVGFAYTCSGTEVSDRSEALSLGCDNSPRILSSGSGDYSQPDRIKLARTSDRGPASSAEENYSSSMDMPGPVCDISVTQDAKSASAVVRNLVTGNYEVYRITAVCGN